MRRLLTQRIPHDEYHSVWNRVGRSLFLSDSITVGVWVFLMSSLARSETGGYPYRHMVGLAQLVRASDCGSEGRGFEPRISPFSRLIRKPCE